MAESIVRLKVDNKEFDPKIRSAQAGLQRLEASLRDTGKTFNDASKDQVAFASSLGNMATRTNSAKGRVRELEAAFVDLSAQYRRMTDDEKKGEYGKALSASLERIKERIQEGRAELDSINSSLNQTSQTSQGTSGVLGELADKFGLNITKLGALGVALGAATAATKIAKDAFFSNEEQLDEWGRTVAASESLYRGFLNALNNGDISGFLKNIDTITQAARDAYDALDELATYNAFNQINVEKTRHALSESINDYREGSGSKEDVKTAGDAAIKELRTRQQKEEAAYKAAVGKLAAERGVSQRDLLDALGGTYGHYSDLKSIKPTGSRTVFYSGGMFGGGGSYQVATPRTREEQLGQALRKINDTELQQLQALGAQAQRTGIEIEGVNRQVIRTMNARVGGASVGGGSRGGRVGGGRVNTTPTYVPVEGSIDYQQQLVTELTKKWRAAADDDSRRKIKAEIDAANAVLDEMKGKAAEVIPEGSLKDLNGQLAELRKERELLNDPISLAVNEEEMARVQEKIDSLTGKTKEPVSQSVSSIRDQVLASLVESRQSADAEALRNLLKVTIEKGLDGIDIDSEHLEAAIFGKYGDAIDIPDEYWEELANKINAALKELGLDPIVLDVKTGEIAKAARGVKDGWQDAARAVQAVGGALQQIEDPAAKIAGIVGQAIANIALGFAQATAKNSGGGVWAWIAAIAGGMGTMLSTISAIKSATAGSYAEGGIIPGHNYNDGLVANVSSGELILNRAQQGNIASQLEGGIGSLQLDASLRGEDIILAITRTNKRMGRGEYAYSKSR